MSRDSGLKLLSGSALTSENARRLYRASKRLAGAGEYGPACSLLILAAEESIKAVDRWLESQGVDLDPRTPTKKRQKHVYRHRLARAIISISYYLRDEISSQHLGPGVVRDIIPLLLRCASDIDAKRLPGEVQRLWDWWEQANMLKQRGFYVDESGDHWWTPQSITKDMYSEALAHVRPIMFARLFIRLAARSDWWDAPLEELRRLDEPSYIHELGAEFEQHLGKESDP